MATGRKSEHSAAGTYRAPLGASRKGSRHIRSFSLTQTNSGYLDGVNKGHRSDVVNRALEMYRTGGTVNGVHPHELVENIANLQSVIRKLYEERNEVASSGQVANNEAKNVPQSRGIWRIFHFIRSFWL